MNQLPTSHKGTALVPIRVPCSAFTGSLSCTPPGAHKGTIFYISEGICANA